MSIKSSRPPGRTFRVSHHTLSKKAFFLLYLEKFNLSVHQEPKELSDAVKDSDSSGTGPAGMDRRVLGRKRMHRDGKTQVGGWRNEYGEGLLST